MQTIVQIQNLKCGGCANTIMKRLSSLTGVLSVLVNEETAEVTLDHEQDFSSVEAEKMLSKLGYPVIGSENTKGKIAKSYLSCAVGRLTK